MARTPSVEEQERALRWVRTERDQSEENRRDYSVKWDTWEKMYRSYSTDPTWWEKNDKDWRSKIFVPVSFTVIETIVPRLVSGLFGASGSFFRMMPTTQGSKDAAKAAQQYMEFLVYQEMDFFMQFMRGLKAAPKMGTGFFKVYSAPEVEWSWAWGRGILGFKKGRKRKRTVRMRTHVEPVNIYDLWFHPLAKEINGPGGAASIIERIRLKKARFQWLTDNPNYFNIEKVKDTDYPSDEAQESDVRYTTRGLTMPGAEAKRAYVHIYEACGDYDLEGNGKLQPTRIRVANDRVVISLDPVPETKPYFKIDYGLNEDDIYGQSALEPIVDLNDSVNTFVRQRLDNSTMLNWGMFKKRKGADIGDATVKPGKFFSLQRMGDLEQLKISDHTGGLMNDVAFLSAVIDRTTGVNDYVRGGGAQGKQTAFEVGTLVQESHARFDLALRLMREEGLTKALDLIWDEAVGHLDPTFSMRILKEDVVEFRKQTLGNILGTFDWRIEVPPYQGNRMLMAQRLNMALQTLGQIPGVGQRMDKLISALMEALEIPGGDEAVADPMKKYEIVSQAQEASAENQLVTINEPIGEPEQDENHEVHLKVHQNVPEQARELMVDHVNVHQQYLQSEQQAAGGVPGQEQGAPEGGIPGRGTAESEDIRQDQIRSGPGGQTR